ncbi:hypothetical protein A3A84_01670 [Candidatus Collierbacteria bacterium RIFCSPLOWO2_01_FULL_50_23]|uniref:Uncharacterized protein n=2 Tax=Candidatus Collieribacteriota TaxID=1752725 RepID=A0A1F5ET01_9BACT|nr:MAG: hypothetical protein A3D09_00325 [Candidatus Collierbacteria bacterium RIFCSPHIGHO2_02_FULL_49_10]OGD72036.1 MAG: hypothetical protein A2703_01920 [Candidatus Collierbacteria bacterium RIFCSPHIGHO2_01_FULL_50_25]OGD73947.1 MAG: hypothetical protein A3A84_01670 [Candidatus Collierbacteria bacterium RIFCSPLOWO2_01_FULL_50_23]
MKSGGFWKQILPDLVNQFSLGKDLTATSKTGDWEKCLIKAIKKMDTDEFNLFLAQVVIKASSKQIMGVDLTAQIQALKALKSPQRP